MTSSIMVVAKSDFFVNKFEQPSLRNALNLKDFLEQTGDYDRVSLFQRADDFRPVGEWVEMAELEC